MAGLLQQANESSRLTKREILVQEQMQVIAWALASKTPRSKLLDALSHGDPELRKEWRQKLRRWSQDGRFQAYVASAQRGQLILETGEVTAALVRRAKRGRVDAVKLVFELAGLWSSQSKVAHEHSGEVKLTFTGLPRPPRQIEEPIEDAEVVED